VTRYSAPSDACLISVPLDGLTAVYHRPSAQTHVLIEPAPQILNALRAKELTLAELRTALGLAHDQEAVLQERLSELEESGLVLRA
jgi:PqqD family protein of HPr-rel-A system